MKSHWSPWNPHSIPISYSIRYPNPYHNFWCKAPPHWQVMQAMAPGETRETWRVAQETGWRCFVHLGKCWKPWENGDVIKRNGDWANKNWDLTSKRGNLTSKKQKMKTKMCDLIQSSIILIWHDLTIKNAQTIFKNLNIMGLSARNWVALKALPRLQ